MLLGTQLLSVWKANLRINVIDRNCIGSMISPVCAACISVSNVSKYFPEDVQRATTWYHMLGYLADAVHLIQMKCYEKHVSFNSPMNARAHCYPCWKSKSPHHQKKSENEKRHARQLFTTWTTNLAEASPRWTTCRPWPSSPAVSRIRGWSR